MPIVTKENAKPIDYLILGHVTQDLTDSGPRLGGTVAYSGLTANRLGKRVGIVSSFNPEIDLSAIDCLQVCNKASQYSTTFKNIHTPNGRIQYLYDTANCISMNDIPPAWMNAEIIHIGPVINEIDMSFLEQLPDDSFFMTPQGFLRSADHEGRVHPKTWDIPDSITHKAKAIVISNEDVQNDEVLIEKLADLCKILVVTENEHGARIYWHGDMHRFTAPDMPYVEDTGAGDIFGAAFFCRLNSTRDPWEATRFAIHLSSISLTKRYFESIPDENSVNEALTDIIG